MRVVAPLAVGAMRCVQDVRISGAERIPEFGPVLVVSNHTCHLDALSVCMALYRRGRAPVTAGRADLFTAPVLGWALRRLGQIPVYRSDVDHVPADGGSPASSLRTSEVGNQSEQATQLAGSAIHSLARSTSADAYNEDAKARTGMLLANCPAELVVAAQMPNDQGAAVKDPETGSPFPEATSDDMRTLIYDVADSTSAVTTMSSTVADYTHNHAVALAQEAEGDEQTKISALNNEYNHGVQAAGLIAGLADNRAADITSAGTAKSDGAESAASTALGAFSTAVSTGLSTAFPEATLASAAWSTFSTVSTPAAVDALTPDASYQASQGSEGLKSGLWVSLIRDTANLGLLRDTDFNPDKGTYGWLNNDARTIDLTGTDPATVHSEMVDWTNTINSSTRWASEYDPNIPAVADNMHEFFGSGRDSGHEFSTE